MQSIQDYQTLKTAAGDQLGCSLPQMQAAPPVLAHASPLPHRAGSQFGRTGAQRGLVFNARSTGAGDPGPV